MVSAVDAALARAAKENKHESRSWKGMCQCFVRTCWGVGGGYGSAYAQWRGMPKHAKHVGGKPSDAPVGAALFYKGKGPYGHIMLAAPPFPNGTPAAWSNDLVRNGEIDKVARTAPTTHWGQRYLGYGTNLNGVDLPLKAAPPAPLLDVTPAPTPPVELEPAFRQWFDGLHWNLAVSDVIHGRASWTQRLPGVMAAITYFDRDVLHLVEACTPAQLSRFEAALGKIGYRVAVYDAGRCIAVREAFKVGRTRKLTFHARAQGDTKHMVLAEVWSPDGPNAAVVAVAHLEYREPGALYDEVRVAQGKEAVAAAQEFAEHCGVPPHRIVQTADENSNSMVSAQAYGTTFADLGSHDGYANRAYSTLVDWDGDTHRNLKRIDKIHVHQTRPAFGGTSIWTAPRRLSDHLSVWYRIGHQPG